MTLKVSKTAVAVLAIVVLGFGAFLLFVTTTIPGEYEILASIETLEKQPLPASCPKPSEREGLLPEVTRMAIIYKSYKRHDKAVPQFLRMIEIQKQICGQDYPGLLVTMNLLAESYELSGNPEKAVLLRQEIRVREERLNNRAHKQKGT